MAPNHRRRYSPATIAMMVRVIRRHCIGQDVTGSAPLLDCAFISTPSIFFALDKSERTNSRVLDYDRALGTEQQGVLFYDFNEPTNLPAALKGAFRSVVIDPPFITQDVWEKYAQTAKWLLAPGGLVVATTVVENATMMSDLLGVHPNRFLPSIPNLPYQYALYTSFEAPDLDALNAEVPVDPAEMLRSAQAGVEALTTRAREAPITGKGNGYNFEAMIEAAMKNSAE